MPRRDATCSCALTSYLLVSPGKIVDQNLSLFFRKLRAFAFHPLDNNGPFVFVAFLALNARDAMTPGTGAGKKLRCRIGRGRLASLPSTLPALPGRLDRRWSLQQFRHIRHGLLDSRIEIGSTRSCRPVKWNNRLEIEPQPFQVLDEIDCRRICL